MLSCLSRVPGGKAQGLLQLCAQPWAALLHSVHVATEWPTENYCGACTMQFSSTKKLCWFPREKIFYI